MRRALLFLFAAVIVCSSCSSDLDDDMIVSVKLPPSNQVQNDSLSTNEGVINKDSVDVPPVDFVRHTDSVACYHCDLNINARLLVDGDTTVDLSNTKVSVTNIVIETRTDDNEASEISEPNINSDLKEPSNCSLWDELPQGLRYSWKPLFAEPILIEYNNNFVIDVTVHYTIRTKTSEYLSQCEAIVDTSNLNYSSDARRNRSLYLDLIINLSTIQFNATVSADEESNEDIYQI